MKVIFFVIFLSVGNVAFAINDYCNDEYLKLINDDGTEFSTVKDKIDYWKKQKGKCPKNGVYEYRLSLFYSEAQEFEKAKAVIKDGLKAAEVSNYREALLTQLGENEAALNNFQEALDISNKVITEYDESADGYLLKGKIFLFQKKYEEALPNLTRAASIEQTATVYSLLVSNYHFLGDHKNTVISMQKALRLDSSELSNRVAIPLATISLINLNYLTEAEELLIEHQKLRPQSENDPLFVQAAVFLEKAKSTKQ